VDARSDLFPTFTSRLAERRWSVAGASLVVLVLGILFVRQHLARPDVVLLVPEAGAEWLTVDKPFFPLTRKAADVHATFRTEFDVATAPARALLTVRGLTASTVLLDGTPVDARARIASWKLPQQFELGGKLTPGTHRLEIQVSNHNGPGAVLAYSEALGLFSGPGWQTSINGHDWNRARPARDYPAAAISQQFPPVLTAVRDHVLLYACVFLVVLAAGLARLPPLPEPWGPLAVRGVLFAAWVALAVNNFAKLPLGGFDVDQHLDYVRYVAQKGRIPLATEGWQMFQSPLYYLIAGALYHLVSGVVHDQDSVLRVVRLVSIAAGALQIELCYRAAKYVWPGRSDLHWRGAVFGGFLPMNLYSSQMPSNEPMAGMLTAAAIVVGLKLLCKRRDARSRWTVPLLGLTLGLAILTKVTPIVLLPAVGILLLIALAPEPLEDRVRSLIITYGIVLGVSGWYYVRNFVFLGVPFIGGWASERGIVWWQDPGYRTPNQFYQFGDALVHPIYSGVASFWNALYSSFWLDSWLSSVVVAHQRPPWNYDFVLAGAWLGMLPTVVMMLGVVAAFRRLPSPTASGVRFALACGVLYLGALGLLFLDLPVYAVGKATYTLGVIPCYAVLAVAGFQQLDRAPVARAVLQAGMACWALAAYAAYFVA
jgi:hypothetical protein